MTQSHDIPQADAPQSRVARCRACKLERLFSTSRPPAVCSACRSLDSYEVLPLGVGLTPVVNTSRVRPVVQNVFPLRPWGHVAPVPSAKGASNERKPPTPVSLGSIETKTIERYLCGIEALDRAMGTCASLGTAVGDAGAISGPPGTGKSTLLLGWLAGLVEGGKRCLAALGEESPYQVALRAHRIGIPQETLDQIDVISCDDYDDFAEAVVNGDYDAALLDSMQTMMSKKSEGSMESIRQIKYGSKLIAELAHGDKRFKGERRRSIQAVCHADKDGNMAGPNAARHHVDALYLLEHFDPDSGEALEPKHRLGYVRLMVEKNRSGDAKGSSVVDERGRRSELAFRWIDPPGRIEPFPHTLDDETHKKEKGDA